MSSKSSSPVRPAPPRQRLTRAERHRQLLDTAWRLVREEGTESLALGRLADEAGVTKPVVYDHFGSRGGLLAALYREYDANQTAQMSAALRTSDPTLSSRAAVIASAYVECVLSQGREIPGVIAALAGSPELDSIKREYEAAFMQTCREALAPCAPSGRIASAGLWALLGAAESLSYAAATGAISAAQAQHELYETIVAMVSRNS